MGKALPVSRSAATRRNSGGVVYITIFLNIFVEVWYWAPQDLGHSDGPSRSCSTALPGESFCCYSKELRRCSLLGYITIFLNIFVEVWYWAPQDLGHSDGPAQKK